MASSLLWTMRGIVVFTTWFLAITPAPVIYKIARTKRVGETPLFPLAALLASCHMWLLHGYINGNIFPAVMTFIVGDTIALAYLTVYVLYTSNRLVALQTITLTLALLLGASAFAFTTRNDNVVGPAAALTALVLYGWPFERMQLVIKHKTNEHIPVTLVTRATLNNVAWIIYTILDHNWFTLAPHVVMVVLGVAQLSLYWRHHPRVATRLARRKQQQSSGSSATHADDLEMDSSDRSDRGDSSVSHVALVVVDDNSPKPKRSDSSSRTSDKLNFPQSPSYALVHSPLAPLHGSNSEHEVS